MHTRPRRSHATPCTLLLIVGGTVHAALPAVALGQGLFPTLPVPIRPSPQPAPPSSPPQTPPGSTPPPAATPVASQPATQGNAAAPEVELTPEEAVENYLASQELWEVLASHLRKRLEESNGEERLAAADRLGRLYVRLLGQTTLPEQRQRLEEQSRALLRAVPDAESFELRINLAKASYLPAEQLAERFRLGLASQADRAEAERVLRTVGPAFEELAGRLNRKVEGLERKESLARDPDMEGLRIELAEARRLRSLARYYAGWSGYYTALLTGSNTELTKSLIAFGALLNAVPGRQPTLDRLPKELLRYEHVARAALGVALALALDGKDVDATRWLDAVDTAEAVPPAVLDQVFSRKLVVYAAASRWADVEVTVRRRRESKESKTPVPLSVADARLLAVVSLEAMAKPNVLPNTRAAAERMAQAAMGDLVSAGEVGHVLDLVTRYGTAPIGDTGFIVRYVRGLQTYEAARQAHRSLKPDDPAFAEEPAADAAVVNRYREAAGLLGSAVESPDAVKFPGEVSRSFMREGLAFFYAGDLSQAANRFEKAAAAATSATQKRDAIWYAVVTLDRAVEDGQPSFIPERDRLATLYLREFPASDNAAKLLLRQTRADRLTDKQALDVLMRVPKESPLYEASRRQAARILYQAYRSAGGADRDFAATRFADVADEVTAIASRKAMEGKDQPNRDAALAVVLFVRQIADVLLGASTPDLSRAEAALDLLDQVSRFHNLNNSALEPELLLRRLQIAGARNDERAITMYVDKLRPYEGPYSQAADRVLYRRAARLWKQSPQDLALARAIVRHGTRVLAAAANARDPGLATARDTVAAAAFDLWGAEGDTTMRDLVIATDRAQLESGNRTAASLRRLAVLLENTNDTAGALSAWTELLVGSASGTPAWYEARHETLRLMLATNPVDAKRAAQQYRVIHTAIPPEPWDRKINEILEAIDAASTPQGPGTSPPPATPAAAGGQP